MSDEHIYIPKVKIPVMCARVYYDGVLDTRPESDLWATLDGKVTFIVPDFSVTFPDGTEARYDPKITFEVVIEEREVPDI